MRLALQRVKWGSVRVNNELISSIKEGLVVLVGLTEGDNIETISKAVQKILNIRLWHDRDETGVEKTWSRNLIQNQYEVLLVSQFTLYAKLKGNKPDFHSAMNPQQAKELFDKMIEELKQKYEKDKIKTGVFQALMELEIINDGPVTINIEY